MCSFICKLFGQLDVSKKYMVHKNQKNDHTLASTSIVDQDDDMNYSKTNNLHEFLELNVIKGHKKILALYLIPMPKILDM